MTGKAFFVRRLKDWRGDARVYRVEPPMDGYGFVIVSAACVPFTGPETYIFGSDGTDDDPLDWSELDGSYRGGLDHARALANRDYEIATEAA